MIVSDSPFGFLLSTTDGKAGFSSVEKARNRSGEGPRPRGLAPKGEGLHDRPRYSFEDEYH